MPILIRIKINRKIDKADPKWGSYTSRNCLSIKLPIKVVFPAPKSCGTTKVVTAGINTMVIPDITPGMLNGSVIVVKTLKLFAQRSWSDSIVFLSIFTSPEYIGKMIKGKMLYILPITTAKSL